MESRYTQKWLDEGQGPVVLMLHGLFGSLGMWMPLVHALRKSYRVVIPRLPMYDLPVDQANLKFLTARLSEFVEHHRLRDVVVIGHAVGGQLALHYTNLYRENVRQVVLIGSAGLPDLTMYQPTRLAGKSVADLEEIITGAFLGPVAGADQLLEEVRGVVRNTARRMAVGRVLESSHRSRVSPFLKEIFQPVLLVWGREDTITPPLAAMHFQDLLPNAEIALIDHCGHVPMLERPEEFVRVVTRFVSLG